MIREVRVQTSQTNFELQDTQSYGGYVMYWKLTAQLYGQAKSFWSNFSFKEKSLLVLSFIVKTPWWTLIKPLGQFFSIQRKYSGTI